MSDLLEYKGYNGTVEYSADGNILVGKVLGIRDKISFSGDSVRVLRKNFESAIDEYIHSCARKNVAPQKPYRGIFNVRVAPELHKSLAKYSISRGQTLNATVDEAFRHFVAMYNEMNSVSR
jgi:predicted HicB family RNase H-like nuclease